MHYFQSDLCTAVLKPCRVALSAQTLPVTPFDGAWTFLLRSFSVLFVPDAFESETGRKVTLQNVLIQLRKCVAHPYLFSGKKALLSLETEINFLIYTVVFYYWFAV